MAAAGTKTSLLHRLVVALPRRPAAAAAVTSAAAATSRTASSSALRAGCRSSLGGSRLATAGQRLGALHGAAVVCSASSGSGDGVMEIMLKIDGMVCDGCSSRVEEALGKMAGVKKVVVDLEKGLATVAVEADSQMDALAALTPLTEAIKGLGFEAEPHFSEG